MLIYNFFTRFCLSAIATATISFGAVTPALATEYSYSASTTLTPTTAGFSGATAGGDGWGLAFYGDNVYNVFHHSATLQLMCTNRVTGQPCVSAAGQGVARTITGSAVESQYGALGVTDVVLFPDGTLGIELTHSYSDNQYMTDSLGNPFLNAGMPFTLAGVDGAVDGYYTISTIGQSIHNRILLQTVEAPGFFGAADFCSYALSTGQEMDWTTETYFDTDALGNSCDATMSLNQIPHIQIADSAPVTVQTTFQTSAKPSMYVDQTHGYLFVAAAVDASGVNSGHSDDLSSSMLQPGIVCIDLNQFDQSENPACTGLDGQPAAWTPLAGTSAVSHLANSANGNSSYGINNMIAYNDRLYVFNPTPHLGNDASQAENALLCMDLATYAPCSGDGVQQPFNVDFGVNPLAWDPADANATALTGDAPGFGWPSLATSDTLIGSRLYIPMDTVRLSYGYPSYRYTAVACLELAGVVPAPCDGVWPLKLTDTGETAGNATIPVIPYLAADGTVAGICYNQSGLGWHCYNLDGSEIDPEAFAQLAMNAALKEANEAGQASGFSPGPLVIGTKVLLSQLYGADQISCFDFATGESCSLTSASHAAYPVTFDGIFGIYELAQDPVQPSCIWFNSDGGSNRATSPEISNFNIATGNPCTMQASLSSIDLTPARAGCAPTGYGALQLLSYAANALQGAAVIERDVDGNVLGVVDVRGTNGSNDLTTTAGIPSADLTPLNSVLPANTAATFTLLLRTTSSSDLSSVSVRLGWVATKAGCDQPLPSAPNSIAGTAGTASATVEWTPPLDGPSPTKYIVSIPGQPDCVVDLEAHPSAQLRCTFTGLTGGTAYVASVVAVTVAGSSTSISTSITPRVAVVTAQPLLAYVHDWQYQSAELTGNMRTKIRAVAAQIVANHCTKVTLTGYSNLKATRALSLNRALAVSSYMRTQLNRIGGRLVVITVKVGGATAKFNATVLNRTVVISAK